MLKVLQLHFAIEEEGEEERERERERERELVSPNLTRLNFKSGFRIDISTGTSYVCTCVTLNLLPVSSVSGG